MKAEPAAKGGPVPFRNVTAGSGVDFEIRAARGDETTILDTIGHGAAVLDYDRDGKPDLVLLGRDRVAAFRNEGDLRFRPVELGLRQEGRWGGAAVADVDNNGWPDLYLTGYGCAALYLNGPGGLREATRETGLLPPRAKYPAWGASAGFCDLDRDGWADLVVCYYLDFGPDTPQRCGTHVSGVRVVCPPKVYSAQRPRVYRNLGGKGFQDVTGAWGMTGHGSALGVAFQDTDGDGQPEVAIANDEQPGDFFRRQSSRWVEAGGEAGTAYDRQGRAYAGMGLDWGDVNGDGKPDMLGTAFYGEEKPLYLNQGGGLFQEAAARWGLSSHLLLDVAFGARLFDYDNDGRLDALLANGHIQENARALRAEADYPQPLRLFRNAGEALVPVPGLPSLVGRAVATADFDGDGGTDVVVSNLEGTPLLLRNEASRGHWLGLRLQGTRSNRMGLGARVTCHAGGRIRTFEVHTSGSYMAASDPGLVIGLGEATAVESLEITWPAGGSQKVPVAAIDRWIAVHEEAPPD